MATLNYLNTPFHLGIQRKFILKRLVTFLWKHQERKKWRDLYTLYICPHLWEVTWLNLVFILVSPVTKESLMSCLLKYPNCGCAERSSQIPHEPPGKISLHHWRATKARMEPCSAPMSCSASVDTLWSSFEAEVRSFYNICLSTLAREGQITVRKM